MVTREIEYEIVDKRENKRLHKKGRMQEESKSEGEEEEEDVGIVQKKTVTEKRNFL